jgi:hypothetical protein
MRAARMVTPATAPPIVAAILTLKECVLYVRRVRLWEISYATYFRDESAEGETIGLVSKERMGKER